MVPTLNYIASGYKRTLSKLFVACYEQATERLFNQGNIMTDQSIVDALHVAVCQAMALLNQSVGVVSDIEGLQAKNILREALFNYQPPVQAARQSSQSEPVAKNETIATALISKLKRMPMSNAITPQLELDIRKILLAFKPIYLAAPQQAAAPIDNVAVPVAEIRWIKHLEGKASEFHEYGASEGKRLPVGTKLYAAPQQTIPSEPTDEMIRAAIKADYKGKVNIERETLIIAYKAMLSASPTAPIERDK
jgi:hypothetical protein